MNSRSPSAIRKSIIDFLDRAPREVFRAKEIAHAVGLRGRSDYSRHSRKTQQDPERVIRRAYDDILHREPDPEGMRTYRSLMIDKDWTESDVREALRKSAENDDMKGEQRRKEAEKMPSGEKKGWPVFSSVPGIDRTSRSSSRLICSRAPAPAP